MEKLRFNKKIKQINKFRGVYIIGINLLMHAYYFFLDIYEWFLKGKFFIDFDFYL